MFRVAHLSDLHATPARGGVPALLGKRLLGWLSWRLRRHRVQGPEVLDALLADLAREAPDQVVVTGDLTNIAGEEEFPAAREWLARIGPPESASLAPATRRCACGVRSRSSASPPRCRRRSSSRRARSARRSASASSRCSST